MRFFWQQGSQYVSKMLHSCFFFKSKIRDYAMFIEYVNKSKSETKHSNNYTDDIKRDRSKENGYCHACIFTGENEEVSKYRLCAETMSEISEVNGNGYCDKCKPCWHWYNQINPIKKWMLEKTGFVFKNR